MRQIDAIAKLLICSKETAQVRCHAVATMTVGFNSK